MSAHDPHGDGHPAELTRAHVGWVAEWPAGQCLFVAIDRRARRELGGALRDAVHVTLDIDTPGGARADAFSPGQLAGLVFVGASCAAGSVKPIEKKDAELLLQHVLRPETSTLPALTSAIRGIREFVVDTVSLVPSLVVEVAHAAPLVDALAAAAVAESPLPNSMRLPESELAAVVALQRRARSVYGTLESGRAIAWAVEELGELAQAIRRQESKARFTEELGHLFAWVLCLANILEVEAADALRMAMHREMERQLSKYGRLQPAQLTATKSTTT